ASIHAPDERLEMVANLVVDLVPRAGRVETHEALWLRRRELFVSLGDLAVELDRFALHAVLALPSLLVAAESGLDRSVQPARDVRSREGWGPDGRQTSCPTLVGESCVVVAVGDDDLARRERR